MTRREEYLAHEARTRVLAERVTDGPSRDTLRQAADSWRLLAEMETVEALIEAELRSFLPRDT